MKPGHRRINIFAGPGAGKSTLGAYIFFNMKMRDYNIELVQEYVKELVYDKRVRRRYHQLKIFSNQLEREERILSYSDDIIVVTHCPFLMSITYAKMMDFPDCESLINISKAFDEDYPSVNIFLRRTVDVDFKTEGRFQDSVEEAQHVDDLIFDLLNENGLRFVEISSGKHDVALDVAINGYPD